MGGQERTRGLDARVAELAGAQHGVVTRRELLELGMSGREIDRRVESGRLLLLYRGVYAVGHRALTRHSHWLAAVRAHGPSAVLSHRSAAALWGFRSYSGAYIDVTSPSKAKSRGSIRRHFARLQPDEVTVRGPIPVTTVPRTIFDLAGPADAHLVEACLRQCEYLRLYDRLSLWDLLKRHPRQRGNGAVRTALAKLGEAPGEAEEGLEERFLVFLDAFGLPRPELNAWLEAEGHLYKADCLWRRQRLIAELDSWRAHGTRSSFRTDKTRDRHLLLGGYATTRIAESHLELEPDELAADLRRLLRLPTP